MRVTGRATPEHQIARVGWSQHLRLQRSAVRCSPRSPDLTPSDSYASPAFGSVFIAAIPAQAIPSP